MKHLLVALLFPLLCMSTSAQTINTFAGKGTSGYSGDGGIAKDCELNHPFGITVDHSGWLYVADRGNNCIRMISPAGQITTIAGNGIAGFGGDGGPATAAQLNSPVGVAIDALGNVYISDLGNNRIRMILPSGQMATLAGTGVAGYSGDGGPATSAQLFNPRGITLRSAAGNLFIADQGNNRIRTIDAATGIITTVAGNGLAGFSGDGGPATAASLKGPYGIDFSATGMYIADVDNQRVRVVRDGNISTFAGNGTVGYSGDFGPATAAAFNEPIALLATYTDVVYVADAWNGRIRQIDGSGNITTYAGNGTLGYSGDGGRAVDAQLNDPYGLAFSQFGNMFVADYANNRIRYLTQPTYVAAVNALSSAISVTPNPNNGACSVQVTTGNKEPVHLAVTNVTGQKIKEVTGMTNTTIDLQIDVADGIYFLTASTDHDVWHQQIVKGQ